MIILGILKTYKSEHNWKTVAILQLFKRFPELVICVKRLVIKLTRFCENILIISVDIPWCGIGLKVAACLGFEDSKPLSDQ